ncbi:MAG: hypothetical protein WCE70_11230, partial [Rhodanobacteraceae bacterium]
MLDLARGDNAAQVGCGIVLGAAGLYGIAANSRNALRRTVSDFQRAAFLNGLEARQYLRRFNFGNGARAEGRKRFLFQGTQHVSGVVGRPLCGLLGNPFTGDRRKRVFSRQESSAFGGSTRLGGIGAADQQGTSVIARAARCGQVYERVLAQREHGRLAIVPIAIAPKLGACRSYLDAQAIAVRDAVKGGAGAQVAHFDISKRHVSKSLRRVSNVAQSYSHLLT